MAEKSKAGLEAELTQERAGRQRAEQQVATQQQQLDAHAAQVSEYEQVISELQAENTTLALRQAARKGSGPEQATVEVDGDVYRVIAPSVQIGLRKVTAAEMSADDARQLLAEGSELLVKVTLDE